MSLDATVGDEVTSVNAEFVVNAVKFELMSVVSPRQVCGRTCLEL